MAAAFSKMYVRYLAGEGDRPVLPGIWVVLSFQNLIFWNSLIS
jgi:hypothetical protein